MNFSALKNNLLELLFATFVFYIFWLGIVSYFWGVLQIDGKFFSSFFFFSVDDNDVPLLLAVAGTHAPQSITLVG